MATPKKNNNSLYIKGCLGCAAIFVLFFVIIASIGGYLAYLEETALSDHSKEILIVPITKGQPTEVRVERKGSGRVKINMWVRGPGLTDAKGEVKCSRNGVRLFDSNKGYYGTRKKKEGPPKHIWIRYLRMSSYSIPNNCVARFTMLRGKGPFEIVVTQSQRPSDWF